METRHFQKLVLRMKLQSFTCHIVNMRVLKYVFTRFVFKIKIFHSCRSCSTRVAIVSFVQHSCCTCVAIVSLMSYPYCTHLASFTFVLYSCWSCCVRVVRVWHLCCKLDQTVLLQRIDLQLALILLQSFRWLFRISLN